jgi:apoptotic chromatin condensation inducer in the nucleus
VVTETVSTEVVVGGQDSCSSEKNNEDSAIKLGNEESKAQLDSEDSKPQLESDTKPPCDDLMPNSSAPENQVSEVNPSLGTQVKSDSFSTDSVSINQKNELKDTIIANNVKLEQDNVRPEMVEEPSSRNDVPVYDESHSVDVGGLHEKKPSGEENNNNVTSPELNKTNSSDDVGYPEKVNLDRSSGDDSMEEDLPEIRQYDSKFNDELSDKVENNEVLMGKEQSKPIVVGDGVSARNSDTHQDMNISTVSLTEKRKYPGTHIFFYTEILFILCFFCTYKGKQENIQ